MPARRSINKPVPYGGASLDSLSAIGKLLKEKSDALRAAQLKKPVVEPAPIKDVLKESQKLGVPTKKPEKVRYSIPPIPSSARALSKTIKYVCVISPAQGLKYVEFWFASGKRSYEHGMAPILEREGKKYVPFPFGGNNLILENNELRWAKKGELE